MKIDLLSGISGGGSQLNVLASLPRKLTEEDLSSSGGAGGRGSEGGSGSGDGTPSKDVNHVSTTTAYDDWMDGWIYRCGGVVILILHMYVACIRL